MRGQRSALDEASSAARQRPLGIPGRSGSSCDRTFRVPTRTKRRAGVATRHRRMRTALKLALAAPCAFVVYAVLAYTYTAHHRVGPRNPFAARAATPGHIPQWLIKTGTPQRARTPG